MPGSSSSDDPHRELFLLVARQTGCDFSQYKPSTLGRRLEQRFRRLECQNPAEYLSYLSQHPDEITKLQRHLLIGVTSFFRNPRAFLQVEDAWEAYWAGRSGGAVRVWVGACSTGEEAYSLTIQIREFLDRRAPGTPLQVFATDLDAQAIDRARKGWYPDGALIPLDHGRLTRWFEREGRGWRVRKELRDHLTFAVHNLLTDPPFGQLDLVSCRNVLIYLNSEAQSRLTAAFAFALKPNGLLFLGTSESVDSRGAWFVSLNKKAKVYRRSSELRLRPQPPPPASRERMEPMPTPRPQPRDLTMKELVLDLISRDYAVPCVLVDVGGAIQFVWGDTGPVFRRRAGRPTDQVVENVVDTLQVALANALAAAVSEHRTMTVEGLRLPDPDPRQVRLTVRPVEAPVLGSSHFLVVFQLLEIVPWLSGSSTSENNPDRRVEDLERELNDTRLYLRNLVLKLESANEELAAGNEEAQSMNEELQSSNEELESSREELQATNDELAVVNAAHAKRIEELDRLSNDLANLIASARLGMIFLDRHLGLERFTPEAAQVLSLREADLQKPFPALVGPQLGPGLEGLLVKVLKDLQPEEREVTAGAKTLLLRVLPYRTTEDRIDGLVLTLNDLTDLRAAEAEGRRSERKFQVLFENNPDGILLGDLVRDAQGAVVNFRIVGLNPAFARMLGNRSDQAVGRLGSEVIPFLDRPWLEAMNLTVSTGKAQIFTTYTEQFDLHLKIWIYLAGENRFALLVEDITHTARVQEELRQSEALFRSTLTSMDDFVSVIDRHGRYLDFFQGHRRSDLYIPPEEFLGKRIDEVAMPAEVVAAAQRGFDEISAGAPVSGWTYCLPYPQGVRWFSTRLSPRFDADGNFDGAVQVSRDITDQILADQALREREAELRAVFEASPLGLFLAQDDRILRANSALVKMYGAGSLDALPLERLAAPGRDGQGLRPDGTTFPLRLDLVDVSGRLKVGVVQDLTERQRMERTVLNSQRLESLGVLAGGIAHDFNNLLGGLFGFIQLARKATEDETLAAKHLDRAFSAFGRAQDLTRQLLTFSKGGEPIKKVLNLKEILEESARFILSGANLKLELDIAPNLWPCEIDRHQLGQVIDNLGLNSRQAMPGGGTVRVSAFNTFEDGALPAGLESGPYVLIRFSDDGPGIPADILPRIFDPFFSTKKEGTGLGLATVYSILRKHGGLVEAESPAGGGVVFQLWFPALPPGEGSALDTRRILVLDDEELILDTAVEMLVDLGYDARGVRDGRSAVELFRQARKEGRRFGFFLTDLTLPGEQGGLAVVEQLRRLDPRLRAAASSGYSDDPVMADPGSWGLEGFLPKPYTRDQLSAFLSKVYPLTSAKR